MAVDPERGTVGARGKKSSKFKAKPRQNWPHLTAWLDHSVCGQKTPRPVQNYKWNYWWRLGHQDHFPSNTGRMRHVSQEKSESYSNTGPRAESGPYEFEANLSRLAGRQRFHYPLQVGQVLLLPEQTFPSRRVHQQLSQAKSQQSEGPILEGCHILLLYPQQEAIPADAKDVNGEASWNDAGAVVIH